LNDIVADLLYVTKQGMTNPGACAGDMMNKKCVCCVEKGIRSLKNTVYSRDSEIFPRLSGTPDFYELFCLLFYCALHREAFMELAP